MAWENRFRRGLLGLGDVNSDEHSSHEYTILKIGWPIREPYAVNPRILCENLVQLSQWASSLKIQTFGRERPAELYEFLPQNPGIYREV